MIEAKDFIEAARELGFVRYTGVPCSFLTPFINYVINDDSLEYIASSNEGDGIDLQDGTFGASTDFSAVDQDIIPDQNNLRNLGSSSKRFNDLFG